MNAEVETLLVERPNSLVVPNNAVVQPQEVAPAAAVLGLDPEVELDYAVYSQLAEAAGLGSLRMRGARGGVGGAGQPQESGDSTSQARTDRRAMLQELRAKVETGEISQDSLDAVMASFRAQMGGQAPGTGFAASAGGAPEMPDMNPALAGLMNTSGNPRPAVAFVMLPDSTLELRQVLMGVNDWDNTEILAGLEEGEMVALIGVAQLMQEQEDMRNRMMGRGMMPMGRR
jgi:hypothetical protein